MALNETSTHLRTAEDELTDIELAKDNLLKESWKNWPNQAGVIHSPTHQVCFRLLT